jgi:hypothetical protein
LQGKSIVVFLVVLFIVAAYVDYSQNATITGTGSPEPRIVISLGQDLDSQGKNKVMQIFSDWQKKWNLRRISNLLMNCATVSIIIYADNCVRIVRR